MRRSYRQTAGPLLNRSVMWTDMHLKGCPRRLLALTQLCMTPLCVCTAGKKKKKKTSMKNANTNTEGCKSERGKQSRGVVLMQDLKMCGGWFEWTYSIVTLARERRESKESDGACGGMKRNRIDLLSAIPWKKTKQQQTNRRPRPQYVRQTMHTCKRDYLQVGAPSLPC